MSDQGIRGNPDAMVALAKSMQEAAGHATLQLGKSAATFERMLQDGGWSDAKGRAAFERYQTLRGQIQRSLDEVQRLQAEIAGTAQRYRAAQGR
jgi:uncharacterized protein YukE